MKSFDVKKLYPHLLIVLGFAVLSLLYCMPVMKGMVLHQGDIMSWKAMYHEAKTYHDSTGVNPLWTNSMFGGMPTYTIGVPESNNYIGYIQTAITTILAKPAYFFFLSMLCFYVLMAVMRVDRWLAVIASFAFAFSTNNAVLIAAGHDTKVMALSYLPAVFAGLIVLYRGRWLPGAALLGLSLTLMVGANHFQVDYYALIMIGFYVLAKLIITLKEQKDIKAFLIASIIAIVIAGVSVGPSMASILTTKEYVKTTMRGGESELTINHDDGKKSGGLDKDYAFMWSNGIGETFSLMIPYLYGGSTSEPVEKAPETEELIGGQAQQLPLYWGPQNMGIAGPQYLGAIVCFLFVLSLFVVKSGHKWWILAVCVLMIMMSWGDHFKAFNYFLFDNLPLYNKFRAPTMSIIIPQLLFPFLGFWGLWEIVKGNVQKDDLIKNLKIAVGITAGLCILLGVGGSMFFDYTNPVADARLPKEIMGALKNDRAALAMKSGVTSAVFILLAAALIWAFVKEKINRNILIGGVGLLVAIDLFSVAHNYLNDDNYIDESEYEAFYAPRPVDQQILQDKDPYYRVLDVSTNTYNDAVQAYWHKCIGGYSPAKMEIYQDMIDMNLGGAHSDGKFNSEVLNMLNTKYIIFNGGPQQTPVAQQVPTACGNAWFVDEVKFVKTADEEMTSLKASALGDTVQVANAFNPRHTAIVHNDFAKELNGYKFGKDSTAAIKLTRYGLNKLEFTAANSKDGFAVFSDIWYPYGWQAYVDGKETPIVRANYLLRAIKIPAGNHKVEFRFDPQSYKTGDRIAMISSIVIIALLLVAIGFVFKNKEEEKTIAEDGL